MNPTEESFTRTRWCLKQIIKHHFVLGNARIHVAQKTITADKLVHHQGSGRATDDENDVATCRSPSIPEVLQGRDKV